MQLLISISRENDEVVIRGSGEDGGTYQLLELSASEGWVPVATQTLTEPGEFEFFRSIETDGLCFYRVSMP